MINASCLAAFSRYRPRDVFLVLWAVTMLSTLASGQEGDPFLQPIQGTAAEDLSWRPDQPPVMTEGIFEESWEPAAGRMYEPQNDGPLWEPDEVYQSAPQDVFRDGDTACAPEPIVPQPKPWLIPVASKFQTTWAAGNGDTLGMLDIDGSITLMSLRIPGLMITPNLGTHFLSGPDQTDLPSQLYDHTLDIGWMKKINDRWSLMLGVAPSFYTDYQNTSSEMVRVMGRAIVMWQYSDTLQLAFGAVYLDREDIPALPAVGLIYTPTEVAKLELMFPKPRILRRVYAQGDVERWVYLGGELGGGSWAIERSNGENDVFTYSALRLLVGIETKRKKGFAPRLEAGYVFNRKVEYESGNGDYDPGATAMIRFGASF